MAVTAGPLAVIWIVVLAGTMVAARADGSIVTADDPASGADLETSPEISTDIGLDVGAETVIVPGARVLSDGRPSTSLRDRLDAALVLYRDGRVANILVSGDNRESTYNEPAAMRDYLVDAGVPAEDVTVDYAGLDTWDTCLRAVEQFGVADAVIVTQDRHAHRTGALCRTAGIEISVLALPAPDLSFRRNLTADTRETLAKVKAWHDIVRRPTARHNGPFVGLVGSVGMPEGGHPPDWNWGVNQASDRASAQPDE